MKEVQAKRYAGPFSDIPYDNYIQSPIGLVPKGKPELKQTRLIFHLSFNFNGETENSFNACTPRDLCSVKYNDIDHAIKNSLRILEDQGADVIYYAKTDVKSAFRLVPGQPEQFCWLILKCEDPVTKTDKFFVDKNMPFGASISCALYQEFSESLRFLIEKQLHMPRSVTNYLDDYLFIAIQKLLCDHMVNEFVELCEFICVPIAIEKTEWGTTRIVFLGLLLDGEYKILIIPQEKRIKALNMINWVLDKKSITIKSVQRVTGTLNFLNKSIVVGRTFTRRLYAKLATKTEEGIPIKPYHHIKIDAEFKCDCLIWKMFLQDAANTLLCRPFIDVDDERVTSETLNFYTDSSAAIDKGFGCFFSSHWNSGLWGKEFILQNKPSIQFLELYALVIGVFTWESHRKLMNTRIEIFNDE